MGCGSCPRLGPSPLPQLAKGSHSRSNATAVCPSLLRTLVVVMLLAAFLRNNFQAILLICSNYGALNTMSTQ